ncbi:hypothetical protein A0H81_02444 [Grifola frondosa]|uniref:Uncharacterized protein n=1 Tax=Grifola frondosa TaxID=5627 RepID=A0A1C7MN66_GRIFR|nr:hypothetical protein A0H81_02444 [Grifola frondosa]
MRRLLNIADFQEDGHHREQPSLVMIPAFSNNVSSVKFIIWTALHTTKIAVSPTTAAIVSPMGIPSIYPPALRLSKTISARLESSLKDGHSGISPGAIVGIVIACIALLALLLVLIWVFRSHATPARRRATLTPYPLHVTFGGSSRAYNSMARTSPSRERAAGSYVETQNLTYNQPDEEDGMPLLRRDGL